MNSNVKFTGCAFCRANQKPFNHQLKNKQGQIVCQELLQYECPWCHVKGHTSKHCTMTYEEVYVKREQVRETERRARWEENQRVKTEEKVRQDEIKANSWAAKITKKVSQAAIAKMAEDEKIFKAEKAAKLAKIAEEKKIAAEKRRERYEKFYEPNMREKYGVREQLVVPSVSYQHDSICISIGDFWEFYVEGLRDDSELAKIRRENIENQSKFHAYLKEKYWTNWIFETQTTEDDCIYLRQLRKREILIREQDEYEREERERKEWLQINKEIEEREKEQDEMERKRQSGEITEKEFSEWHWARKEEEWEEQDAYHLSGLQLYESTEHQHKAKKAWMMRKTAREQL
jgi:hypothetical protein